MKKNLSPKTSSIIKISTTTTKFIRQLIKSEFKWLEFFFIIELLERLKLKRVKRKELERRIGDRSVQNEEKLQKNAALKKKKKGICQHYQHTIFL